MGSTLPWAQECWKMVFTCFKANPAAGQQALVNYPFHINRLAALENTCTVTVDRADLLNVLSPSVKLAVQASIPFFQLIICFTGIHKPSRWCFSTSFSSRCDCTSESQIRFVRPC